MITRVIAKIAFKLGVIGGSLLLVTMISGAIVLSYEKSTIDQAVPWWVSFFGGVGGIGFVIGSFGLWCVCLYSAIQDARRGKGNRVFWVIVGTIYAAYYFYFTRERCRDSDEVD